MYNQLCRDETPMVRRAAAQRLGAFAGAVEAEHVSSELLPLYTELTGDGALLLCRVALRGLRGWCRLQCVLDGRVSPGLCVGASNERRSRLAL